MFTSTNQDQEEDLIILDDIEEITEVKKPEKIELDSEKIFNLDDNDGDNIINLDSEESDDVIDFVDLSDGMNEVVVEKVKLKDEELNFSFTQDSKEESIIEDNSEEESVLVNENSNSLSFEVNDKLNNSPEEIKTINNTEVFDLDNATEQFIAQLNNRKTQIDDFIKKDESNITDLEEQIKNLKQKVSNFNLNIKKLKEEDSRIDDRIAILTGTVKKTSIIKNKN